MKRIYKILLILFVIEMCIVSLLDKIEVSLETKIGNIVGASVFLFPISLLFFLMSKIQRIQIIKE